MSMIPVNVEFKDIRKAAALALKDEGLRQAYESNIAMCIYDNRRKDGRVNIHNCTEIADKLIKLIFY